MKCFNHPNVDAVAVCKSCGRALCHDCSADVSPGIACKEKCEEDVAIINRITQYSKKVIASQQNKHSFQITSRAYKRNAVCTLLAGIVFFVTGIIPILNGEGYYLSFAIVLGVVFMIWAFFYYKGARQYDALGKQAESNSSPESK